MPRERLQKYIANCGHCSRRKAELLIEAGLVQVDGSIVRELGAKIDPAKNEIRIHGERILPPSKRTIALHKPAGFITSTHDTHDRLTVMDLLPRSIAETGVLPAGRLDLETEGLLILTNDGDLQHRITHPRYECVKEYHVDLDRAPGQAELARLAAGIHLPEFERETSPAEISELKRRPDGTATLRIRIREGMKRQIRRMFEEIGMTVTYLKRLSIGGVRLGDLPRGEWRDLSAAEVSSLEEPGAARRDAAVDPPREGAPEDRPPERPGQRSAPRREGARPSRSGAPREPGARSERPPRTGRADRADRSNRPHRGPPRRRGR